MPRPLTATTASIDFRLLHFGRRSAKSYGQFLTAWVENRKLTLPLDPSRCRTPFALRNSLPRRHDASPLLTVSSWSHGSALVWVDDPRLARTHYRRSLVEETAGESALSART